VLRARNGRYIRSYQVERLDALHQAQEQLAHADLVQRLARRGALASA
jgi:hypothetical protein